MRELDVAQSRVAEALARVDDVIGLKSCLEAVEASMKTEVHAEWTEWAWLAMYRYGVRCACACGLCCACALPPVPARFFHFCSAVHGMCVLLGWCVGGREAHDVRCNAALHVVSCTLQCCVVRSTLVAVVLRDYECI